MTRILFQPPHHPLLIVISGPSGVGKDAVIKGMAARGVQFQFVVTATTRPARPGEVDGVDYFFLSRDQFAEKIERGEFLEWANVYNDFKGTPRDQVESALASGKDAVMRVDVQGSATVKRVTDGTAVTIFLSVESEEQLESQLRTRKNNLADDLKLRIATARQELQRIHEFDYFVVNKADALDDTVDTIQAIIQAEHNRVGRRAIKLPPLGHPIPR
jgi:guanylate kinase